ncbi:hypothetical protein ACWGKW_42370 [Streptomyces sp. NPDC054766]
MASYEVYRATSENGSSSRIGGTGQGSYRDATAERGITYYWVTAVHADGTESVPGTGDTVLAP